MSTTRIPRPLLALGVASAAVWALAGCSAGAQTATQLEIAPADVSAMCAEITPEALASADLAFAATVASIDGDRVTLDVDEDYAGDPGDRVVVPQQSDDMPGELSIGAFAQGEKYLITTTDGVVRTCGQSGPLTPQLQALYDASFAG